MIERSTVSLYLRLHGGIRFWFEMILYFVYIGTLSNDSNRTCDGALGSWTIDTYTYSYTRTLAPSDTRQLDFNRHKSRWWLQHPNSPQAAVCVCVRNHPPATTPVTSESNVKLVFCDGLNRFETSSFHIPYLTAILLWCRGGVPTIRNARTQIACDPTSYLKGNKQ